MTRDQVWARIRSKGVKNFAGCLVWTGGVNSRKDPGGLYGRVTFQRNGVKRSFYVHRLALWVAGRMPLRSKLEACHQCHFSLCFDPTHLEPGTHVDNIAQREERWRRLNEEVA